MRWFVLTTLFVVVAGCKGESGVERESEDLAVHQEYDQEQLASLVRATIDAALDERLASIETSLEQIELRLDLVREDLKSAQVQEDRLAALESEIKQALVDLGNVIRRAISLSDVRQPDG